MRLLHERRQDFNLLSLNLCPVVLNKNFPISICFNHNKKFCPSPFFISGCAGGSNQADKTYTSQYRIKIMHSAVKAKKAYVYQKAPSRS